MSKQTRILLADDQPIFRFGLRTLLEREAGFVVVAEVSDGIQALKLARQCRPDILLLNADAPKLACSVTLREMARTHRRVRTILLTSAIEKLQVLEWLQLGARGLLLRDSASHLLTKGIHSVMAGQYWVGREVVLDLVEALRTPMPASAAEGGRNSFWLTAREFEIVETVVAGFGNKEIADRFAISEHTVKHHLTRIFDKTGASSRLELAVFALKLWSKTAGPASSTRTA
jgi:DNA-binding NarL/FixJ family response regulator